MKLDLNQKMELHISILCVCSSSIDLQYLRGQIQYTT